MERKIITIYYPSIGYDAPPPPPPLGIENVKIEENNGEIREQP